MTTGYVDLTVVYGPDTRSPKMHFCFDCRTASVGPRCPLHHHGDRSVSEHSLHAPGWNPSPGETLDTRRDAGKKDGFIPGGQALGGYLQLVSTVLLPRSVPTPGEQLCQSSR